MISYIVNKINISTNGNDNIYDKEFYKFYTKEDFELIYKKEVRNYLDKFILIVYSFSNNEKDYFLSKDKLNNYDIIKEYYDYLFCGNDNFFI